MRRRFLFVLTLLAALAAPLTLPWLAWREAQRQAYDAQADLVLSYARDVLHRTDKTAAQVMAGIARLARLPGPPCSPQVLEVMRDIDLTSAYIQAIGYVQDGVLVCSSMGTMSIALGPAAFRTSRGVTFYLDVPRHGARQALVAFGLDHYAALVHRDLPLDVDAQRGVTLGVVHLERTAPAAAELAQGRVERRWLARLGKRKSITFIEDGKLIAIARSDVFKIAAIAAVPTTQLGERTTAIAMRLVPAGIAGGLVLAMAILLLARQQMSLATAVRAALRRKEFFLEYQPIVDLATGEWIGAEALLRWRRPTGERFGPDLFIPVAEQTGLVGQLTRRVLDLVAEDAGPFLARHPHFHIAINVAPSDLASDTLIDQLDAFLARTGAAPSNLLLEITERGFIDLERARTVIARLRGRGIPVAIDDFGTGYSSLSYLESLDLDFLKIDRSFIVAIGTQAATSHVVRHIIAMAKTMGLRMIAEGVERPEQAQFLRDHQVHFTQGWLYGKPMPFADIVDGVARQGHVVAPGLAYKTRY